MQDKFSPSPPAPDLEHVVGRVPALPDVRRATKKSNPAVVAPETNAEIASRPRHPGPPADRLNRECCRLGDRTRSGGPRSDTRGSAARGNSWDPTAVCAPRKPSNVRSPPAAEGSPPSAGWPSRGTPSPGTSRAIRQAGRAWPGDQGRIAPPHRCHLRGILRWGLAQQGVGRYPCHDHQAAHSESEARRRFRRSFWNFTYHNALQTPTARRRGSAGI